jgi:hypothetical protein
MSSDLIGRRRASEQRLDRARSLELVLKEKTDILAESTGMSIEQLDFDGSFRAALTALAAVASRRTHFDIIVTLPDAPFAMRIQHVNNAVSAEVLIQRDGPFEPVESAQQASVYAAEDHVSPSEYLSTTGTQSDSAGAYADSARYAESERYAVATGTYSASPETYPQTAAYSASTGTYSVSPSMSPSVAVESYTDTTRYTASTGTYSASTPTQAVTGTYSYSETAGGYESTDTYDSTVRQPESLSSHGESRNRYVESRSGGSQTAGTPSNPPEPVGAGSAEATVGMVHVASDLADLLWQGVDDMPS